MSVSKEAVIYKLILFEVQEYFYPRQRFSLFECSLIVGVLHRIIHNLCCCHMAGGDAGPDMVYDAAK